MQFGLGNVSETDQRSFMWRDSCRRGPRSPILSGRFKIAICGLIKAQSEDVGDCISLSLIYSDSNFQNEEGYYSLEPQGLKRMEKWN